MIIVLLDPSFSWTRNGSHFDEEKDSKVLMKPGSGTLVIDISGEKAEAYEGTYQCTAHNEHGTAVSNNIVIRQSSKTSDCIQLHYFHWFFYIFLYSNGLSSNCSMICYFLQFNKHGAAKYKLLVSFCKAHVGIYLQNKRKTLIPSFQHPQNAQSQHFCKYELMRSVLF